MGAGVPTASQIIAALVMRLEPESKTVTLTWAEVMAFQTKWPTTLTGDDEAPSITVSVDPGALKTNPKWVLE
jgi:hypothetical protein